MVVNKCITQLLGYASPNDMIHPVQLGQAIAAWSQRQNQCRRSGLTGAHGTLEAQGTELSRSGRTPGPGKGILLTEVGESNLAKVVL